MTPSKLSNQIIEKIEQEKINPRSRWYFIAKNIGFWGLFAAAMIVGGLSFALTLYAVNYTDFSVTGFVPETEILQHWLTLLPTIWIFCLGLATGLGIFGLKHTKRGYRIALVVLLGSNLVGSALLGGGLYAAGGGEMIEEAIEEHVPFYEGTRQKHQRFWGNPESTGRLAGRIQALDKETQTITLEGPYGRQWTVPYGQAEFPDDVKLEVGRVFKMKGRVENQTQFRPQGLKPDHRHERLQRRVEDHLQRHPQLRRSFEQKLEPATRERLEALKQNGERPAPNLREQMRQEVRANTTEAEREQMRETLVESLRDEGPRRRPAGREASQAGEIPSDLRKRWQDARQDGPKPLLRERLQQTPERPLERRP